MHDLSAAGPTDWLELHSPERDEYMKINLSFLASNWKCIYGQGCPGMFGKANKHTVPDLGCCTGSFYITADEKQTIQSRMEQLTAEDWDDELYREYIRRGTWHTKDERKGLVVKGACIFANRADGTVGSTGKTGCAFLHLGNRLNAARNDLTDNSEEHERFMPTVCWQLPLYTFYDEYESFVVTAWSNDQWTDHQPRDEDGTSSSHHHWWCVDSPDTYVNDKPVYVSMERELRSVIGDWAYDIVAAKLREATPMPYPASPEGRKLIATLGLPVPASETVESQVGSRTPARPMP